MKHLKNLEQCDIQEKKERMNPRFLVLIETQCGDISMANVIQCILKNTSMDSLSSTSLNVK